MNQTVYVDRKYIKLTSDKKQLVFHTEAGRRTSLPFRLIDRLIIHGHCLIDTYLLGKLSENNITTVLFSSLRAKQAAVINGLQHNDASIHIRQYQLYEDQTLSLNASKKIVKAKLLRQYRLLKKMQQQHPERRKVFFDACASLWPLKEAVSSATNKAQLLGIEGSAARIYFGAYKTLFTEELNFKQRRKRPAVDPVNAILSLSYTLFSSRCTQALSSVGLDPYIGFYHSLHYSRKSLAVDMMEPWRPLIDLFVYRLFKDHQITAEQFDYKGTSCLLDKEGRSRFYPAFEHEMKTWQKGINRMARIMVKALQQQIPDIKNHSGQLALE